MKINIRSSKYVYVSVILFLACILGFLFFNITNPDIAAHYLIPAVVITGINLFIPLTWKKYDALDKIERTITSPDTNPQQKKILLYSVIIGLVGLMALLTVRIYFHF